MVIGLCGALSTAACSSAQMAELKKEVVADVKQAQEIKKGVEAAKKGDLNAAGDTATVTAVKSALTKNEKTRTAGIEVEAKSGTVTLKGKADDATAAEAEKVAKGIPGVTKVVNELNGKAKAKSGDDKDDKDPSKQRAAGKDDAKDAKDSKDAKDPSKQRAAGKNDGK
jgi:hypothetical protein